MFDVHCAGCDARVLLTTRRIVALENTDTGIYLTYRCWDGHEGLLVTGHGAHSAASPDRPHAA